MSRGRILIADDECRIRRLINDFLEADGYSVVEAENGEEALNIFCGENAKIDLVVLDIMMPKMDGREVCREIRRVSSVPIIMLTALTRENDEIFGLNLGADEYIGKPFSPRVFVARVEALLRRSGGLKENKCFEIKGISLDTKAHTLFVDNTEVYLSLKEYDLLLYFMENEGCTLSREKILNNVWSYDYLGDSRTVDTHITKLRKKLGAYGDMLMTIRGVGYKFDAQR